MHHFTVFNHIPAFSCGREQATSDFQKNPMKHHNPRKSNLELAKFFFAQKVQNLSMMMTLKWKNEYHKEIKSYLHFKFCRLDTFFSYFSD